MPKRLVALLLVLMLAAGLTACGSKDDGDGGTEDGAGGESQPAQDGDEYPLTVNGVRVATRPVRVLSLAPAITEKLCDLGFGDRLVGRSEYCDYPDSITGLPVCGTAQYPDVDGILALDPHIVLSGAQLPADAAQQLELAGITVVTLGTANSVTELENIYIDLAKVMEGATTGQLFAGSFLQNEFRPRLEALRASGDMVALYLREMRFTIAPGNSLVGELLEWTGYQNVAAGQQDWQYDDAEDDKAAFEEIDIIFMDRAYVTITDLEQDDFYRSLNATLKDLYLYVDCDLLERQSMHMFDELERIARARTQGVDGSGNLSGEDAPDDLDDDEDEITSWEDAWDG